MNERPRLQKDPVQEPVSTTSALQTRTDDQQPARLDGRASLQPARRVTRGWVWSATSLLGLAVIVLLAFRLVGKPVESEGLAAQPPATTQVQLRDLAETNEYTGQLQYGSAIPVVASGSGYLTALAESGEMIERGAVVYRLSNDPDEAERLTAEQQVATAASQLATARQQSSSVNAQPKQSDLASAQSAVATAQLALEGLTQPASEAALRAAQAKLGEAQAAYADLLDGPADSERNALQDEVTRGSQAYDQAVATRDQAWINLLVAQSAYCSLSPIPVEGLCEIGDLPLTASDVSALTGAVQTALAGEAETVPIMQSFLAGSSSYQAALTGVDNAVTLWQSAQASLDEASVGPGQYLIDQALAAMYSAQESLDRLLEGPSDLEVAQADANLTAAQARLNELLQGATSAERRQADAAVESARIALEISTLQMSDLVGAPTAVTLFYGDEVSWRTLALGSTPGSDIRQLEENLRLLGFDPEGAMVVDDVFDEATEQAIMRWEASLAATVDGSVPASDLVYSPGPVRVGDAAEGVQLGDAVTSGAALVNLVPVSRVGIDSAGAETVASTQKIVVQLPVDDRDLVESESAVVIELADGTELGAVVGSVGDPVTAESASTVEVVVVPLEPIDDSWTGTNVEVRITSELAEQVLAVPVSALLALVEGGYAVEVIEAGTARLLAVETGMFADGLVEITGEGLSATTMVVVPE